MCVKWFQFRSAFVPIQVMFETWKGQLDFFYNLTKWDTLGILIKEILLYMRKHWDRKSECHWKSGKLKIFSSISHSQNNHEWHLGKNIQTFIQWTNFQFLKRSIRERISFFLIQNVHLSLKLTCNKIHSTFCIMLKRNERDSTLQSWCIFWKTLLLV